MYRMAECDRPSFNTLTFLTKVKPHLIVKDDVYVDTFNRQMIVELYGSDIVKEYEGTTRSFYSLEGHYSNLWKYDLPIIAEPSDLILDEAIELTKKAFTFPTPIFPIAWDALNTVPYIPSSGAGYGYVGKKSEPLNLERAIRLAVAHLNAFKEEEQGLSPKGQFRYTPDLAWIRTSLDSMTDPKIRHIWGTAFHNTLIEGMFAAPLIKVFNSGDYPIVTGTSIYRRIPQIIHEVLGSTDASFVAVGLDYSSFDATVQPWFINVAFDILRSNFVFTDEMHEYGFKYSRKYFIDRPVVMPDSRMWLKRTGIPSGSYFTQIIGSIINYLLIMYIQLSVYRKTFKTFVLGDDSIFGVPSEEGFPDIEQMLQVTKRLGLTIHPHKAVVSTRPAEIAFLGHQVSGTKILREISELLKLLIFTEYPITGPDLSLTRLKGLVMDSALNNTELVRLYEYARKCAKELGFTEAEQFPAEYVNWLQSVVQLSELATDIDLEKIWLIT